MREDVAAMSYSALGQVKESYVAFLTEFNGRNFAAAFAAIHPDCEFRYPEGLAGEQVLVGHEQLRAFFEDLFEVMPDWHVESVRVLQAADEVFVTLDRGRGTGRGSGAPTVLELSNVIELRDQLVVRMRQYPGWEQGLEAAHLDPSIAADVRRPNGHTTS
jgi:ketosteroid isomerase-like protein